MATPYLGQITLVGFNFQPAGWAWCNGQLLPIDQNDALFNLIGTTYGGDGVTTFALPNLQGRVPVHQGTGSGLSTYELGQTTGTETVTLTGNQIPQHTHALLASSDPATNAKPGSGLAPAQQTGGNLYAPASNADGAMSGSVIGGAGGSQPHENMQPFLCLNYIIALQGVYPSQN